jgi:hypothetical protein
MKERVSARLAFAGAALFAFVSIGEAAPIGFPTLNVPPFKTCSDIVSEELTELKIPHSSEEYIPNTAYYEFSDFFSPLGNPPISDDFSAMNLRGMLFNSPFVLTDADSMVRLMQSPDHELLFEKFQTAQLGFAGFYGFLSKEPPLVEPDDFEAGRLLSYGFDFLEEQLGATVDISITDEDIKFMSVSDIRTYDLSDGFRYLIIAGVKPFEMEIILSQMDRSKLQDALLQSALRCSSRHLQKEKEKLSSLLEQGLRISIADNAAFRKELLEWLDAEAKDPTFSKGRRKLIETTAQIIRRLHAR